MMSISARRPSVSTMTAMASSDHPPCFTGDSQTLTTTTTCSFPVMTATTSSRPGGRLSSSLRCTTRHRVYKTTAAKEVTHRERRSPPVRRVTDMLVHLKTPMSSGLVSADGLTRKAGGRRWTVKAPAHSPQPCVARRLGGSLRDQERRQEQEEVYKAFGVNYFLQQKELTRLTYEQLAHTFTTPPFTTTN